MVKRKYTPLQNMANKTWDKLQNMTYTKMQKQS